MAYDKIKIFKKAIVAAKKPMVFFIEDIIALLPISKPTFYDFYSVDSNEFNTIKEYLATNKVNQKIKLRKKLTEGKGSELIAAYKLIGTDEERKLLSTSYVENKLEGEINIPQITAADPEQQKRIEKALKKFNAGN